MLQEKKRRELLLHSARPFSSQEERCARLPAASCSLVALACRSAARADEIDYKKLYARVAPGVVLVYGEEGANGSIGSGSIIRDDGKVVTNAHVILNHDTKKPYRKLFIFLKPDKITGHNDDDLKRGFHGAVDHLQRRDGPRAAADRRSAVGADGGADRRGREHRCG